MYVHSRSESPSRKFIFVTKRLLQTPKRDADHRKTNASDSARSRALGGEERLIQA